METLLTFYIITIIPSAITCHYIAKTWACNRVQWAAIGFLFGIFSLLFIAHSKPEQSEK